MYLETLQHAARTKTVRALLMGAGEYGFMLTAVDADLTPSTDVDLFRIKIWDRETDQIIYDNQMGDSEDADPATEIGGGSIVIHKK